MRQRPNNGKQFFFATAPMPCPYLPGRVERRLVTEISGRNAQATHDLLSQAGFRRSHGIAYAPVCERCTACASVRIIVDRFHPGRSQRRVWMANQDLRVEERPAQATEEQYGLFAAYQQTRHGGGEMARMDFFDYQALVEDTPVDTVVVEFRLPNGALAGACVTDRMADGYSAVYSFYRGTLARRSLGTYMVLWLVDEACRRRLPYVYLGFWVGDCTKMAYKARFQPLEAYTPEGWRALDPDDAKTTAPFRAGW